MRALDLTGQKFGRLTVLGREVLPGETRRHWRCLCECGKETVLLSSRLTSGVTESCGCLRIEAVQKVCFRHGQSKGSSAYWRWAQNPKHNRYADYGGRGITVCERWKDFVNFLADMGDPPASLILDRKDNDGNYEPDNCRWTTYSASNRNKRRSKPQPTPT